MSRFIWRIRFTIAVSWILRDQWVRNRKLYLDLGWNVSRTTKQGFSPYYDALNEITRWYTE